MSFSKYIKCKVLIGIIYLNGYIISLYFSTSLLLKLIFNILNEILSFFFSILHVILI